MTSTTTLSAVTTETGTTTLSGQRVGYLRVSTADQNTARQLDGIALDKVFTDKASGRDVKRPALAELIQF